MRPPAVRSSFGRLLFWLAGCVTLLLPATVRAEQPNMPNILLAVADDWSWPHAGVYGDKVNKTPVFDRFAASGALFTHSFCVSPSCTPSRAAMLTGQTIHRLEDGGNLWGTLPKKFATYADLLEAAGYHLGHTGKAWGPGDFKPGGWTRNPAGPQFKNFEEFLKSIPEDKSFCFWYGSRNPHRPYEKGSGVKAGMKLEDVVVPPYLPDTPEVRGDILDYYVAVQKFDQEVGELLKLLKEYGKENNTLVVITSDNGLPFPRAKANLYDAGTRMPLAVRWPGKVKAGRKIEDFISHTDFAPTFLEAAGLKVPATMTGRSFLGLLTGAKSEGRDRVFVERERHANVRKGDLSYPVRGIRTREFLYLRNLRPDRWPAGDPETYLAVGPFGDIDGGPSKDVLLNRRQDKDIARFFELACGKRPAEELYDLAKDPWQLSNLVDKKEYADAKEKLSKELDRWMKDTADPRASSDADPWDKYPYYGPPIKK
jgi:arylsulfatase A-like enzyme